MTILITVIHVIACFILVLVVLLQAGKGADMGAVFGGASSTIFGSSGAGNFLTRLTTGAAIVFMATSLALTYYVGARGTHSTIMPASAMPKSAPVAQPAADAAGAPDGEAAAVADSAPAAAPAEDAAATVPEAAGESAPAAPADAAPAEPAKDAAPAPGAP
jgi:preprotein translocase subunit SecG